jgi:hypothetical protein
LAAFVVKASPGMTNHAGAASDTWRVCFR